MTEYRVEVETREPLRSMDTLVDIIADGLEALGLSPNGDYEVIVHGPPELHIRLVDRHP